MHGKNHINKEKDSLNYSSARAGDIIEMTSVYPGARGTITGKTSSIKGFYIIKLESGLRLISGPASFKGINKCLTQK